MNANGVSGPLDTERFRGLAGAWSVERRIEGEDANWSGEATLLPCEPAGLAYDEIGRLELRGGQELQTRRRYHYRLLGDAIEIDFADGPELGRLFVRLDFGPPLDAPAEAFAIHHCGRDAYRVRYRLDLPLAFETDIAASGPSKAYRLLSRYRRIG